MSFFSIHVCVICVVCSFCFFKQKTAYEMRISDWSSDVCSSDLPMNAAVPVITPRYLRTPDAATHLGLSPRTLEKHRCYGTGPVYRRLGGREIGRASCRERVWQYV